MLDHIPDMALKRAEIAPDALAFHDQGLSLIHISEPTRPY